MSLIRIYNDNDIELSKLNTFVNVANNYFRENDALYYLSISDIYFDLGQDWKYTALVTKDLNKGDSWQSVCPRDYEEIVSSDSFSEIEAWALTYAEAVSNGKISVDLTF